MYYLSPNSLFQAHIIMIVNLPTSGVVWDDMFDCSTFIGRNNNSQFEFGFLGTNN
jgi:hypothetical protein